MKKLLLSLTIFLANTTLFGADQSKEEKIKTLETTIDKAECLRQQLIKGGKQEFSQEEYLELYANIRQAKKDLQEYLEEIKQRPS